LAVFAGLAVAAGCQSSTDAGAPGAVRVRAFALDGGTDAANTPPMAVDDQVTVDEDADTVIDVLANDVDDDGDALSVFILDTPQNGDAARLPDGTFSYAPRHNFNGSDSFTYLITDGRGGSDQATVEITVTPVNDPPQLIGPTPESVATISATVGKAVEFPIAASDVDDDPLTFGYEPFDTAGDPPTVEGRVFSWTPVADDVGVSIVTIFADDGTDRATRDITIEVAEGPVDGCPDQPCEGGKTCMDGTCVAACRTDDDCPGDNRCFSGRCGQSACDGVTCPDGEACFDGACKTDACEDVSCEAGEQCFGGSCFKPCDSDALCDDGSRCYGMRCAPSACEAIQCAAGEFCHLGTCQTACSTDETCAGGQTCIDGRCADAACDGVLCPSGQDCTDGACADRDVGPVDSGCGCDTAPAARSLPLLLLVLCCTFWRRRWFAA